MLTMEVEPATRDRVARATSLRTAIAELDALVPPPQQVTNGDEQRYADKSGTYTKGVLQTAIGIVDPAAWQSFEAALDSGRFGDFEKIVLGGPRTLNGPQGGICFGLGTLDWTQFAVPPAPALASEDYAAELIELYWASLLRDVAFPDYAGNAVVAEAANELSGLAAYAGPHNAAHAVTPDLLFRGTFPGEQDGPYLSQFLLQSTALGSLPITQQYVTNMKGVNFLLDSTEFLDVQNGIPTGKSLTPVAGPLYLHDGRGLAAYAHDDVLYQAYFTAYLVLNTLGVPLNLGNPYTHSKTQNGFATFGQPDIAATLTAVANEALKAVWFQKWWVHLRHRPESGGAIAYLQKTGQGNTIEGHVTDTVLNSKALQASFAANNSWFLSQAFPEGSPTHPAYPTGHGMVAGACITALKFFFEGTTELPAAKLLVPASDGKSVTAYVPPAGAKPLTVNGELNKLASNISFGHGIHAGIHWRSDTKTSIELGERVALSYLRNHARTYNEPFSISLTKLDGTTATISNA